MTAPVLEARDVVRHFGGNRAVDGMSLTLGAGEIVGLIGPNGAGKTTLFNLIAGSLKPDSGEILLGATPLHRLPATARIGAGLGRTFQIPRPFAGMTVLENVLAAVQGQSGETVAMNFLRPGRVRAEERRATARALELIEFVTLSHLAHEPARVLSGGQRKLLELARAMIAEPSVLLLDEPAAGVNPALLEVIIERILEINRRGVTVLLIEHNMDMIARLCGRIVVMAAGRELAAGTPAQILANREVIEAYLGEVGA
ncbi:ABC transporter ATP-binding protein (plasmid) [Paroceanicella profunda]|uniref:ABC transporter ATP-binding protein n=1 Tax=Paroceanicella profunda TaxID=2579971 RepID=A0A5B8FJF1_9RHOB|nr:ABC transporter ATP-binding protein [Paroceanicella profunda]QDL94238.1 ABC transporter ATP-binding protein [Paroceanicella profunda]